MTEPAPRLLTTLRRTPARRLFVRFYLALLASLLAAAVLFGLAHLLFDPAQAGLAVRGPRMHAMGFVALLIAIALVVATGAYPVVRRLTLRLERLQCSVEAWGEGELSTRVAVEGDDEVARLAASFNHSAARIESLVGAQKTLLANASHELRSPLARIRMAAELMAQQATPAISAELRRNVSELDQLIDEVLLASRLDAAGVALPRIEEVDLTGLLAEECARANATLDAGTYCVQGDARLLRRMVRNLLENAIRYGAGSKIEVRFAAESGSGLRLDVCDGGAGIPTQHRERVFEPFYRLPGCPEAAGGVGLGLSLVRQIARHHGGDARCLPNPGGGCCFRVTLPYAH
ncbi:two-component system OmpR family sensor kinase [Actimicrobium sp. GrIS 1.19]|uniref:sensor histidine kinase n=1 Tax=Actimicrobium sp. GrIS 1.19 TaxID=3071708 RepID=UPI002E06BFA0|nr:two-component system OmpR family sensor kinase [Actimicrobium sp. GrIS 1.19]